MMVVTTTTMMTNGVIVLFIIPNDSGDGDEHMNVMVVVATPTTA